MRLNFKRSEKNYVKREGRESLHRNLLMQRSSTFELKCYELRETRGKVNQINFMNFSMRVKICETKWMWKLLTLEENLNFTENFWKALEKLLKFLIGFFEQFRIFIFLNLFIKFPIQIFFPAVHLQISTKWRGKLCKKIVNN